MTPGNEALTAPARTASATFVQAPLRTSTLSMDLAWSENSRGRCVAAFVAQSGRIDWRDLCTGLDTGAIVGWLKTHASPAATVMLDIPIDGCERVRSYRRLDRRLLRMQMGVLPASNAGARGATLRAMIRAALPDSVVLESHPFSTLRVLHALRQRGVKVDSLFSPVRTVLDRSFVHPESWPPRYKRERLATARRDRVDAVAELLVEFLVPWGIEGNRDELSERVSGRRAADRIDALLGLAPALLRGRGSPWYYEACDPEGGSISLIADEWWRRTFEATEPR